MSLLATTQDQLLQGRLTLEQPERGYRFTTDTVLLAASVHARPNETVLELGCGVGAAMLVAAMRCPALKFIGIEREQVYADFAERNIVTNGLADRVTVERGDITDKELFKRLRCFDHVIANPPYFKPQEKNNADALRSGARIEDRDLAEWIQAANRFVKPKGTVTFIHAADRLDDLITGFKHFGGGITVFPFYPTATQAAKRIIVQATKGSKAPLTLLPGLVLHEDGDNYYTKRAEQVIKHGQDLWQA